MTVGTQLAIAIDRASNQTQARILTDYLEGTMHIVRINNHELGARPIRVESMPVSCLMFLIAEPCWMEG